MELTVNLGQKGYSIFLEHGALFVLSRFIDLNRKVMIVTDDGVPPQYAGAVQAQCADARIVTVPQGEGSKSFDIFQMLCERLLEEKFSRRDLVIAVGGGVVGDLAGFAAASYMRGIGFVNIPTTTLSQIDSSIGGKTAINLNGVKNIVGAFYQPEAVIVDPDTLKTLPERHRNNGLVEALKAGLIRDPELFALFERGEAADKLDEVILRSLQVKKEVVEQDEKEQNLRKILNFGHTIGHGVEGVYGLSEEDGRGILHGEAVAIGMLPMLGSADLRERVRAILRGLGIEPNYPYDADRVYEVMTRDKKTHGSEVTIVRVDEPGRAILEDIPVERLRDFLDGRAAE